MINNLLLVAAGGALGSAARYGSQYLFAARYPEHFYWGTFLVNFIGCLLIGIVYAMSLKASINENVRLFLMTGICGGFTTFSAFTHESIGLLRQQKMLPFLVYVSVSLILCLMATFIGFKIAK